MKITLFLGTTTTIVLMNAFVPANSIASSRVLDVITQPNSPLINILDLPVTSPIVQEELQIPPERLPLVRSVSPRRREFARLSVSGIWDTTEGKLTLVQGNMKTDNSAEGGASLEKAPRGFQILGIYSKRDGSIRAQFVTNTEVEGFWAQNYSDVKCNREFYKPSLTALWVLSKPPTQYWGSLKFSFKSDGSFTGVYGYCDEEPQRSWTGTKYKEPQVN